MVDAESYPEREREGGEVTFWRPTTFNKAFVNFLQKQTATQIKTDVLYFLSSAYAATSTFWQHVSKCRSLLAAPLDVSR